MIETIDELIVTTFAGSSILLALVLAFVLGLRHAADPDHLVAVSTLLADADRSDGRHLAVRLGAAWGLGHGTTVVIFGIPIVLFGALLPDRVQQAVEFGVGLLIIFLGVRLLMRWQASRYHMHAHDHGSGGAPHVHLHGHDHAGEHDPVVHEATHHGPPGLGRRPRQSFIIGLAHGIGGSAGVTLLLLASIPDRATAVTALVVLAVGTAISMAALTGMLGSVLQTRNVQRRLRRMIPAAGTASCAFGAWYASAALGWIGYPF